MAFIKYAFEHKTNPLFIYIYDICVYTHYIYLSIYLYIYIYICIYMYILDLPDGSGGQESACNAGGTVSTTGS